MNILASMFGIASWGFRMFSKFSPMIRLGMEGSRIFRHKGKARKAAWIFKAAGTGYLWYDRNFSKRSK